MNNAIKTIDKTDEELSEIDLSLSDVENDDLSESGDSEEESKNQFNHGVAHGRLCFFCLWTQNTYFKNNDSALDELNYDVLPILSKTKEIGSELEENKNTTKKDFLGKTKS